MKNLIGIVVVVLAVAVGCGGSTRTLTATDVSNIPAGNAVGTSLSGSYLVVGASIDDCNCRTGSCSNVHAEIGVTYSIVQQDGALSLLDSGDVTGTPLLGSVDADDKFSVGGAAQIPSYAGQGVIYSLETGTFSVSGGVPTGTHYSVDSTIEGTISGIGYDCDIQASGATTYQGP